MSALAGFFFRQALRSVAVKPSPQGTIMNVSEAINTRQSVRAFTDRAVDLTTLQGLKYSSVEEAMQAQLDHRLEKLDAMMRSEDIREGLQAFMDKRKPEWKGC